jgi:L-amino acid N-acyltransferase YncA
MEAYRDATAADAAAIAEIYNYYVLHTIVTFEEEAVTTEDMAGRIQEVTAKFPWIVYEAEGRILGYAYAGAWKSRCAYRNSVETTVYLTADAAGKGIGSGLYHRLLERLQQQGLHAAIGGIALPNEASVRLHEKYGFQKIGEFIEVGYKFNQWINVGYWQIIFPSPTA